MRREIPLAALKNGIPVLTHRTNVKLFYRQADHRLTRHTWRGDVRARREDAIFNKRSRSYVPVWLGPTAVTCRMPVSRNDLRRARLRDGVEICPGRYPKGLHPSARDANDLVVEVQVEGQPSGQGHRLAGVHRQ